MILPPLVFPGQSHKTFFGVNLITLFHKLEHFMGMQQLLHMFIKWFSLQIKCE